MHFIYKKITSITVKDKHLNQSLYSINLLFNNQLIQNSCKGWQVNGKEVAVAAQLITVIIKLPVRVYKTA